MLSTQQFTDLLHKAAQEAKLAANEMNSVSPDEAKEAIEQEHFNKVMGFLEDATQDETIQNMVIEHYDTVLGNWVK